MHEDNMDGLRRRWFKQAAFVITASALIGCERDRSRSDAPTSTSTTTTAAPTETQARCDDTSGLGPDDVRRRKELKYTDRAGNAQQTCGGCMHLQPVPGSTSPCKRCSVVPGPVHVDGWCSAWVARVSG